MKPLLVLTSVLCLSAIGCAKETRTGAYAEASAIDPDVQAAAQFAVQAQEKALRESTARPVSLKLVKVISSEKQVVAGQNYKLTLVVKEGDRHRNADAVVWWQAWRKPDAYQLTSWVWK